MNKQCVIFGKRWFDKINGNTYHSVEIYIDSQYFGGKDFEYGYDDHYKQTAMEVLSQYQGYERKEKEMPWNYFERIFGDKCLFFVCNVNRKKDL